MANSRARSLRKRPTIAEQRLWDKLKLLRAHGFHFRRQAPIGAYIVDFVCFSQRLVIEVDGVQHERPASVAADARRDADLHWRGFNVVRVPNGDLMDKLGGVMRAGCSLLNRGQDPMPSFAVYAQSLPPPLTPPHKGEGDARNAMPVRLASGGYRAHAPCDQADHSLQTDPSGKYSA